MLGFLNEHWAGDCTLRQITSFAAAPTIQRPTSLSSGGRQTSCRSRYSLSPPLGPAGAALHSLPFLTTPRRGGIHRQSRRDSAGILPSVVTLLALIPAMLKPASIFYICISRKFIGNSTKDLAQTAPDKWNSSLTRFPTLFPLCPHCLHIDASISSRLSSPFLVASTLPI